MIEQTGIAPLKNRLKLRLDWLLILIVMLAVFNGLPFLAPVFMKLGWDWIGGTIYTAYGFMCHQLAQRSFFLFGPKLFQMYNLADLPLRAAGLNSFARMLALRNFVGNGQLGWKVAWSDRMVAMYISPLLVAIAYAFLRRRGPVKPLPLWAFVVLLLPMAVDGGTHWVSDLAGIGRGFRDSNLWLATLTDRILPASFYAGDALGSFNSFMRLFSGLTFGIAVGGLLYPYLDAAFTRTTASPEREESLDYLFSLDLDLNQLPDADSNKAPLNAHIKRRS